MRYYKINMKITFQTYIIIFVRNETQTDDVSGNIFNSFDIAYSRRRSPKIIVYNFSKSCQQIYYLW
jgi:hypothetical protein